MKTHNVRLAISLATALAPAAALAQHDAHQPTAQSSPELISCAHVQPLVENIIAAATMRLESARQTNNASEMRATVDQLEAALRDIRVQLEPCKALAAAADPHAGHTMPGMPQPGGAAAAPSPVPPSTADPHAGHVMPPAPARSQAAPSAGPAPGAAPTKPSADPHAGHAMPGASAAPKRAPASKPSPAKPERAQPADSHAGHASGQQSNKEMDPVNGLMVDPATAPKTTYQGQTYYFSSEQSLKEFLANPPKFAKKPKG
jgi:YHS domain-containing protein